MHRFISAGIAAAALFVLAAAPGFAQSADQDHPMGHGKGMDAAPKAMKTPKSMMSGMKTTCGPKQTYVKGYTKKNGTKVNGYCRKS